MYIAHKERIVFYVIHGRPLGKATLATTWFVETMTILMQLKTRSQCKTSYQKQKHVRGLLDSIIVAFKKRTTFATTHFLQLQNKLSFCQKRFVVFKIIWAWISSTYFIIMISTCITRIFHLLIIIFKYIQGGG